MIRRTAERVSLNIDLAFNSNQLRKPDGTWTDNPAGTTERSAKMFGKGINGMFPANAKGERSPKTVIPFAGAARLKSEPMYDKKAVAKGIAEGKLVDVDPRNLRASQPSVSLPGVQHYLQGKPGLFDSQGGAANKNPIIYVRRGQKNILTGHHRAAAALLAGKTFKAIVVQEPAKQPTDLSYDPSQRRNAAGEWTKTGGIPADIQGLLNDRNEASLADMIDSPAALVEPTYDEVADSYGWAARDAHGSDETPVMMQSIHQQGEAQIKARTWYSDESRDATQVTDAEKYAKGLWNQYQNPGLYGAINNVLRTGKTDSQGVSLKRLAPIVKAVFDNAGMKTTAPMVAYRAIRSSDKVDWSKVFKPGTTFTDKGIVSATAHNRFAEGWLALSSDGSESDAQKPNDVVMEIRVPKGQVIVGGDPQFIETMLPPGTKMKIISSEQVKAKHPRNPIGDGKNLSPFTYTHVVAEVTR